MNEDLTLQHASELCAGTAHLMSEAARLPYQGQAQQEIVDHDERLSDDDIPNPIKFAHDIDGMYLLAAGDFVHGMHLVVDPQWNLRFSLPSLARSACEYAVSAWMLSCPDRSTEQRLAKTFAVLRHDLKGRGSITQTDQAGHDLLDRCVPRCRESSPWPTGGGSRSRRPCTTATRCWWTRKAMCRPSWPERSTPAPFSASSSSAWSGWPWSWLRSPHYLRAPVASMAGVAVAAVDEWQCRPMLPPIMLIAMADYFKTIPESSFTVQR